jgi:hypothetical protein
MTSLVLQPVPPPFHEIVVNPTGAGDLACRDDKLLEAHHLCLQLRDSAGLEQYLTGFA